MSNASSDSQIKTFETLLETFGKLPKVKQNKTLMEVAGYSHYENVASNILAFFFDPNEEHKLGDLLLREFIKLLEESCPLDLSYADVQREVYTDNGNRIDILITGEDFSICIENKIFHWLANDLLDYSQTMQRLAYDNEHLFKAVLALHKIPDVQLEGGFTSVSYPQFWERILPSLEDETHMDNTRWITFLKDFMDTTENFALQQETQFSCDTFFSENHEAIESMLRFREDFYNRLRQKNSELRECLTKSDLVTSRCNLWQTHKKTCLVFDFKRPEEYQISFDLFVSPTGWKLLLFGRGNHSNAYLERLLQKYPDHLSEQIAMPLPTEGSKHLAKTWALEVSINQIAKELEQIVESISRVLESQI